MLKSAIAMAATIGLAAISHLLLLHRRRRHYLTSRKFQDRNQNKANCTEPEEAIMSDSNSIVVSKQQYYGETPPVPVLVGGAQMYNSSVVDSLGWSTPILKDVMDALAEPNTHLIGVYGLNDEIKDALLEKVYRRVQRDQMFGTIVKACITKHPNLKKIQENIASQLGLTFNQVSKDKRAVELVHRIKNEQSILIVLRDVYEGFDLSKVGIPYSQDYGGCKVLVTSMSEEVLCNHIHTQKNFMV